MSLASSGFGARDVDGRHGAKAIHWWLAVLALLLVLFFLQLRILVNHDVAYYLFVAEKLLAGGNYPDTIYDINPPLIALLSIPPVMLARHLALPLAVTFIIYAHGLILLSLAASWRILRSVEDVDRRMSGPLLVLFAVFLGATPGYDFGQREHLICILSPPYLCLVARRMSGRTWSHRFSILCVTLAAIGFLLKPIFLLFPVGVFSIDAYRSRSLRHLWSTENLTFSFWGALYMALVFLYFPGWLSIAKDAVYTYQNYAGDLGATIRQVLNYVLPASICVTLAMRWAQSGFQRWVTWVVSLFMLVSSASAIIQNKGWSYHFVPVAFSAGLLLGWTAVVARDAVQRKRLKRWLGIAAAATAALGAATPALNNLTQALRRINVARAMSPPLAQVLTAEANGAAVLALATTGRFAPSVVMQAGGKWGSRFLCLLDLPYVSDHIAQLSTLEPSEGARVSRLDSFLKTAVESDIERYRPKFILVDVSPSKQGMHHPIDIIAYFSRYKPFAEQLESYALYTDSTIESGIAEYGGHLIAVYRRKN